MKRTISRHAKISIKITALVMICFIFFSSAGAQDVEIDDTPIKVETLLFTVPLTVSDSKGRGVSGLKEGNFTIYQDGEEQEIELFMNEEAPMNVAILLDTSYSTKKVLDNIQDAARDFVKILRPEDKALVVSFDHRTRFLSGLTSDRKSLSRAIEQASISEVNGSDMYDAITRVLQNFFAPLKGRKAVIVLTDGMVTGSSIGAQQILDSLQEYDTAFYPIIFKTDFYSARKTGTRKPYLIKYLEIFAEETGGTVYEKEATKLKEAFRSIAEELKKQYLLGFYPYNPDGGKPEGYIRIDVDQKGLIVKARKRLKL